MSLFSCKAPPLKYDLPRTVRLNYTGERTEAQQLEYPSNFITTSKFLTYDASLGTQSSLSFRFHCWDSSDATPTSISCL